MELSFVNVLLNRYSSSWRLDAGKCHFEVFGELSPPASARDFQLDIPPAISLNQCHVHHSGPVERIRELCHSVEELDLSANHIKKLEEVFKIVSSMPALRFINLSQNDLSGNDYSDVGVEHKFVGIKSLALNSTRIPWPALQLLLDSMPTVEECFLSLNNYCSIDLTPGKCYSNVKTLHLSGNSRLSNWDDVKRLMQTFPALENLVMADCGLSSIPDNALPYLDNLLALNMSNWPIQSWQCIDRLNHLSRLEQLRCTGLPVLTGLESVELGRQHLIARLPRIGRLNGGDITKEERYIAEREFVRWFVANDSENRPSRYDELCSVHGQLEPLAKVSLRPPRYANIRVFLNDLVDCFTTDLTYTSLVQQCRAVHQLKVDRNRSVGNFKLQLSQLFDIPRRELRLFQIDREMSQYVGDQILADELRRFADSRNLYSLNVTDGDEFLIQRK